MLLRVKEFKSMIITMKNKFSVSDSAPNVEKFEY